MLEKKPEKDKVDFWHLLGKQCDLTIAFEQYPKEDKDWIFIEASYSFTSVFLQVIGLNENAAISLNLAKTINEYPYDVYVVGGCESAVERAAIREFAISNKKYIVASEGNFPAVDESSAAKRRKAGYLHGASYYLSCGSAADAYLASYGVNMSRVFRYNYAAFMEKDMLQSTPITEIRRRALIKRFRLRNSVFISAIDFTEEQGIDLLLEIWKLSGIKEADLLIVSDAGKQRKLYKMARDLALNNVILLDYQPKEMIRELYKVSNAMIYPARYDKWGMQVVEALSTGTPVISSYNVGAVHDLVHNDKTGYIQSIDEPAAWGERMRELMKREVLLKKMRENALSSMRLYTVESRVRTYVDVFKKCAIAQMKK